MNESPVHVPIEANLPGRPGKDFCPTHLADVVALVDAQDAERILSRRWCLHKARSGIYVKEVGYRGPFIHRVVLELPNQRESGVVVDHINRDRLDNRRSNLRAVANVLNLANSAANRTSLYSDYKGVTYDLSRGKWKAHITVSRKLKNIGRFATEAEAALAYNKAAFEAWGECAHLNEVPNA